MVSFISKFLFTATVTAPTFLSLGLIGVIKDSTNYFQLWDDMLEAEFNLQMQQNSD